MTTQCGGAVCLEHPELHSKNQTNRNEGEERQGGIEGERRREQNADFGDEDKS